jgi:perosamine synthetase
MSAPDLDESDERAVIDVLRSGRLALGSKAADFERAVAEYTGARHAVAVSSGTAALHLIVKALGIGEGDEVLVPSFSFAASANVLLYERARPVFVDIEPDTFNLDPRLLEKNITGRTRAIMAVDAFGHPAEWDEINSVAGRYGLKVIDDSCEALGAEYKGRRVGTFGDAAAFAFYPNKQITTGEGGMIVTSDDRIASVCRSLRNQGRGEMGPWLEHERLGYNYRMDEMSAALGANQMRRIESFLQKRQRVAAVYERKLSGFSWLRTPVTRPNVRASWFVYVIVLAEGLNSSRIIPRLEQQGIPARAYFSPVHLQPYIPAAYSVKDGELQVTNSIAGRTIALPFHNRLTESEIDRVTSALARAVASAA